MPGGKHLNMQAWAPEEDQIILDMVAKEGPKWSRIVMMLPGRTVSSVRNRWQRIEKGRKLREAGVESKNRCHQCGEPKRGHVCYAKLRGGPQVDMSSRMSGIDPATLKIAAQLANPSVATAFQHQLTAGGLTASAAPQLLPPPPRRTRSQAELDLAPLAASSSGASSQPDEQHLRKLLKKQHKAQSFYGDGSLFPPADEDSEPPLFKVDVGAATAGQAPPFFRSDTSFFKDLAKESQAFSPRTREMFDTWADSPRDQPLPAAVAHAAQDSTAPPVLKRIASGEQIAPPKFTRGLSSWLANATSEIEQMTGEASGPPRLSAGSSFGAAAPQPPDLMRRRSSRLSISNLMQWAGETD